MSTVEAMRTNGSWYGMAKKPMPANQWETSLKIIDWNHQQQKTKNHRDSASDDRASRAPVTTNEFSLRSIQENAGNGGRDYDATMNFPVIKARESGEKREEKGRHADKDQQR